MCLLHNDMWWNKSSSWPVSNQTDENVLRVGWDRNGNMLGFEDFKELSGEYRTCVRN